MRAECPRCGGEVAEEPDSWACALHGVVVPLWRPRESSYEVFAHHLARAGDFPTYLPWPLGSDWRVTDFAVMAEGGRVRASVTACAGTSLLDGPVELLVVAEEAGAGLGSRVAGTVHDDPGAEVADHPPVVRVRIGHQTVPMWSVSTSAAPGEWDRSVVVGEAFGRWLWLVVRPASAMLLLRDDWILRDVSAAGPHLVELPFGGPPPAW
ncbi:DUF6758 family protein [Nocardioides sp. R-C-SC26]|uniref:DUF6758 family protein n=1 Tax=Nocardioides sp. R-C-SC26 TaxID=2870414 RepID=UPI001E58B044|nr:DUF6758 family protein [Nocardioides sp. R-C-SC26]